MKQLFAALAVIAVSCAATLAYAAEGEPSYVKGNIEVYGSAKVSIDSIDTGGSAPEDTTLTRVSTNASRLGFKGTEGIEGGIKTVFQVELGINFDGSGTPVVTSITSTTTGATKTTDTNFITMRNTFAGLKHDAAGTVLFGIHDTPYKISTGRLDPFADKVGDYNAIVGNVGGTTNFDLRTKDTVAYFSPSWAGVSVALARSTTGSETNNNGAGNSSLTSASLSYDMKPVFVTAAYEVHRNGYTTWDTNAYPNTGIKVGAGVAFGDTKIGAVYEKLDDDKQNSDKTRNAMYLSLSQAFGKETINLAYGSAGDGDAATTKTGATMIAVGLDHKLSKRTTVYVSYSSIDNEENATYAVGTGSGASYTPAAGKDPSAVSLGIVHNF